METIMLGIIFTCSEERWNSWATGYNNAGQLGTENTNDVKVLTQVGRDSDFGRK